MFGIPKKRQGETTGYSGSDSYKYIDELINDSAKVLRVATPFISVDYANMLLNVSKRKHVRLIVSGSKSGGNDEAVRILLKKGRNVSVKPIIYGSIIAILVALAGVYPIALSIGVLLAIYIYRAGIYLPKRKHIRVKVSTRVFVHEKLYISENSAIVGSANLTYSGTHRNVEHIEVISDKGKIRELEKHFDELWLKS